MTARSETVDLSVTPYYHCISRCVRRAFLCGEDCYTGENFDHRKPWVRGRLRLLTEVFAINVCAYAVMSNHVHVVLWVDEARGQAWPEAEVIERYTRLYPLRKEALERATAESRKLSISTWRQRLCDLSWFMRALNEYIARKANKEDGVSGRFWEGRFKSQALVDEAGLLTCMAYVDLNPVRAGIATSLEASEFTSVQERMEFAKKNKRRSPQSLAPFDGQEPNGEGAHTLPMSLSDYLQLLTWTGSQLAKGKRGKLKVEHPISNDESPSLLVESEIDSEGWLETQRSEGLSAPCFVGNTKSLLELAAAREVPFVQGIGLARTLAVNN